MRCKEVRPIRFYGMVLYRLGRISGLSPWAVEAMKMNKITSWTPWIVLAIVIVMALFFVDYDQIFKSTQTVGEQVEDLSVEIGINEIDDDVEFDEVIDEAVDDRTAAHDAFATARDTVGEARAAWEANPTPQNRAALNAAVAAK